MKKNILLLSAIAILAGLSFTSCNENTPKP